VTVLASLKSAVCEKVTQKPWGRRVDGNRAEYGDVETEGETCLRNEPKVVWCGQHPSLRATDVINEGADFAAKGPQNRLHSPSICYRHPFLCFKKTPTLLGTNSEEPTVDDLSDSTPQTEDPALATLGPS
jgi:hypothetical protein